MTSLSLITGVKAPREVGCFRVALRRGSAACTGSSSRVAPLSASQTPPALGSVNQHFCSRNETAGKGGRLSGHGEPGREEDGGTLLKKGQPVSWGWSHAADLQSAPSRFFAHYRRTPLVRGGEVNKRCEQCLPFSLVLSPPSATGECDKLAPGEGMKAM